MTNFPDATDEWGTLEPGERRAGATTPEPEPQNPGGARPGAREASATAPTSDNGGDSAVRRAKEATGTAASDMAHTAKHEASHVAKDVGERPRQVFHDAGQKTAERVGEQQKQWTQQLGDTSQELREMVTDRPDTPATALVAQLADRSSMLADYLSNHRPQDVLSEVEAFARRRPGTFVIALAAAGFVAGRLGKSVTAARSQGQGG